MIEKPTPISAEQTMFVLATTVCNTINTFTKPEDTQEEKTKIAQCLFTVFVYHFSSLSTNKKVIAQLLRVCADEMDEQAQEVQP